MGLHSNISPSAAKRWINCPGSVAANAALPERKSSIYAAEGTCAHTLGEKVLRGHMTKAQLLDMVDEVIEVDDFKITVDEEMVDGVLLYVDTVRQRVEALKAEGRPAPVVLEVEKKVIAKSVDEHLYGTSDANVYQKGNTLEVIDLKYGKGVAVEAEENEQGMIYAIGAMDSFAGWVFDKVRVIIVQPRAPHAAGPVRIWETSVVELRRFADSLKRHVADTRLPNALFRAGEWCKFCGVKADCRAVAQRSQEVAGFDFSCTAPAKDDVITKTVLMAPTNALSLAEAVKLLAWEPVVSEMFKAIKERIENELNAGRPVPGYKLVDKKSNRQYIDVELVKREFEPLLGDRLYTEREVISPAQLEKRVGKGKIDHLTYKPPAGKTVAVDTDPRRATVSSAQDDFGSLLPAPSAAQPENKNENLFDGLI
jgi:hypothetical protein